MRLAVQKESTFEAISTWTDNDVINKNLITGLCCAWGVMFPFHYVNSYIKENTDGNIFMSCHKDISNEDVKFFSCYVENNKLNILVIFEKEKKFSIDQTIAYLFNHLNDIIEDKKINSIKILYTNEGCNRSLKKHIKRNIPKGVRFRFRKLNHKQPIYREVAVLFNYLRFKESINALNSTLNNPRL